MYSRPPGYEQHGHQPPGWKTGVHIPSLEDTLPCLALWFPWDFSVVPSTSELEEPAHSTDHSLPSTILWLHDGAERKLSQQQYRTVCTDHLGNLPSWSGTFKLSALKCLLCVRCSTERTDSWADNLRGSGVCTEALAAELSKLSLKPETYMVEDN